MYARTPAHPPYARTHARTHAQVQLIDAVYLEKSEKEGKHDAELALEGEEFTFPMGGKTPEEVAAELQPIFDILETWIVDEIHSVAMGEVGRPSLWLVSAVLYAREVPLMARSRLLPRLRLLMRWLLMK